MPINNYSANIVQNKLFEDIPSLYLAAILTVIDVLCVPCRSASLFWARISWLFKQRLLAALSHIFLNKGASHSPQLSGVRLTHLPYSLLSRLIPLESWWVSPLSCQSALHLDQHSQLGVLLPKNWPHATTDTFLWCSREFSHSRLRSLRG